MKNALTPTIKGQLPHANKGSRKTVPIRLPKDDHRELKTQALSESRSMSFVAMRRYLLGRAIELQEQLK